MDLWDYLEIEELNECTKSNTEEYYSEQMELEQGIISKKPGHNAYSVERNFVNSKDYHDKFERLPVNKSVQQMLYIQAGRLLDFVDGQEEERMIAVNARTGEFLVDNFAREGSIKGTGYAYLSQRRQNKNFTDIVPRW